ncbi:site-specific integrase [Clostridium sp. UBA1652]|uniref:site-specific integrase n=1 Tax=Clostridium sp. UBA1652 TaxID=1946348 RepID=UPI00257F9923|nr:site-specific integrase [Clostridium sp. UBA1652]
MISIETLIELKKYERHEFFSQVINYTINDEMKYHVCIFEKDNFEPLYYSKYFRDKILNFTLKNKSINTVRNFHLTFIVRFLNFIFNDSKTKIDKIENLTFNMVEEFLDKFSQGDLQGDRDGEWKSKETVERATYAISNFTYWLWWKKDVVTNKKIFKMKYIKEKDFEFNIITKQSRSGYVSKEVKKLTNIVVPNVTSRVRKRHKVVEAGDYTVSVLIELAEKNDPMITFGIILGAYLGLRLGDIVQLHEGRIKDIYEGKLFGGYFDFTYDTVLRSDNVATGGIKTKRNVPIYPGCTKIIYDYYKKHINYLKSQRLYPNKYGALFMNEDGYAMTDKTYLKRFNALNRLLEVALLEEASRGKIEAIREQQIMMNNKITPHSLRYYYKQLIESCEANNRIIQYYMAHKSIESQIAYNFAKTTKEGIRKCQDKIYSTIKRQ